VRDISARLLLEAEKRSASERLSEAQLALEAARRRELGTGAAIQQRLLFGHPPPGQQSFPLPTTTRLPRALQVISTPSPGSARIASRS